MVSARFVDFAHCSLLPPLASPPFPVVEFPFPWVPVAVTVGLDFDTCFAGASFGLAKTHLVETPMSLLGVWNKMDTLVFSKSVTLLVSSYRPECHFEEVGDRTQSCESSFVVECEVLSSPSPGN